MAILKNVSITSAPKKFLEYILNGDKNSDMKYASEINCVVNVDDAHSIFKQMFETNTKLPFRVETEAKGQKVRIHHYIQSFSPSETVTPEEANKIGQEFVKKAFGENCIAIVSTHIDKDHIHNHIALSPYTYDGKHIISNEKTLERYRKISDKVCVEHGLSIIKLPKHKNYMKYNEWMLNQEGKSYKQNIRNRIDEIVNDKNTKSIEGLAKRLKDDYGYDVRLGKFMTIRSPDMKKAIRTKRLGDGYELDDLIFRIEHKDLYPIEMIRKAPDDYRAYAYYFRMLLVNVSTKPYRERVRYDDVRKTAELLSYITKYNIGSVEELEAKLNNTVAEFREMTKEKSRLEKRIFSLEQVTDGTSELERANKQLDILNNSMAECEKKKNELQVMYKTYLKDIQNDVYFEAMNAAKELQEATQQDEQILEQKGQVK